MRSKLIIMLTHNDRTVKNAVDLFLETKDLPIQYWGFKELGIPKEEGMRLLKEMKAAGKTTVLEVVSRTEEECMREARLAVEMGFDYLTGTIFYPSVWEYLKKQNIKYFPFVGKHVGTPGVLDGTIEEMLAEAETFAKAGVHGLDLSVFRYTGDQQKLAKEFVAAAKVPVVIAGSIADRDRMVFVNEIGTWGFTVGSALFNNVFVKDGGFRENLKELIRITETID